MDDILWFSLPQWIRIILFILISMLPGMIALGLSKNFDKSLWEDEFYRTFCFIPIVNVLMFIITIISICRNWTKAMNRRKYVVKEAQRIKKEKYESQKIKRMEAFIINHGYTMEEVDDFYESLSMMDKFLE